MADQPVRQDVRPATTWPWIPPELELVALTYLSTHFRAGEFACRCGCGAGLNPGDVSPILLQGLEQLRTRTGKRIYILSGLRCPARNVKVGGAAGSRHIWGEACDIQVIGMGARELYDQAVQVQEFANGGLGVNDEPGTVEFLHVDVRPSNPPRLTRWCYAGGKEVSWRDAA